VLFIILALSYIGLMLMLGARQIYVPLNVKYTFKSIGGMEVPVYYAMIFVMTWAIAHTPYDLESVP
jgi:ABC-2 type transport system permease protein